MFFAMSLGDALAEVLALQKNYTHVAKNPSMRRRKQLVERDIPELIVGPLQPVFPGWSASGSSGMGSAAEVPWSRYHDPSRSPAPTRGWYAVYLFTASGDAVYLSLNQGTSTWDVGRQDFVFRPKGQLAKRVSWARSVLTASGSGPVHFSDIDLGAKQALGKIYQAGNVHGIRYEAGAIPSDDQLHADVVRIARQLDRLYDEEDQTIYIPGDEAPEVLDAELAAEQSASNARRVGKTRGGQGFRLNQDEKKAIELHAVELATKHFVDQGFKVKDTGATESYDLLATKGDETIFVEVKGTASLGEQIIVTRAEVEHHRRHPNNALVVVHSIRLSRETGTPVASGGQVVVRQPWEIDDAALTVVSYRCKLV
ncbi:DUF3578 domain-containing protein [Nocardia neocaledoniensis]|uniref:MrcB family domain-containing protein n=1 Tax=Nocardia neocaledoniensis TaxID=236511 RepID=UPI0034093C2B